MEHHPFWGYRRVHAYLSYHERLTVSKNKVYRLMSQSELLVKQRTLLKASRVDTKKPKATTHNQWWGIDMTKVMINGYGWIYVVITLDWYTKKVVGHYVGEQAKSVHWIEALEKRVNQQFPNGVRNQELQLMSDNGCQSTSVSFMKACSIMGIKQAFTSYNNPKGNADTERFMRTMKEELVWINEWQSPMQFKQDFEQWINEYNHHYLHSTLGYLPPVTFEQNSLRNSLRKVA